MRRSWIVVLLLLAVIAVLATAPAALAYDESQPFPPSEDHSSGDCYDCHGFPPCTTCHLTTHGDEVPPVYQGPHGSYDATTSRCDICHTLHDAPGSLKLLPGDTILAVCESCHDGTGGHGVYGAIFAQTDIQPRGGHSIDATNSIPGGNASDGGSIVTTFTGEYGRLTCSDCHSPHDSQTVADFYGDRMRSWPRPAGFAMGPPAVASSSKLLRQQPTGAATPTAQYGSDWCLGCHAGRGSGGMVYNHPVESSSTVAVPYTYNRAPVVNADTPTSVTVLGQIGGHTWSRGSGNRGYLMPVPRTAQQTGHLPLCQQCHEDSRDVGDLTAEGLADAQPSVITTPDGFVVTDNPRFQNFPHETVNQNMLVESGDDLCLNCHATTGLP